MTTQQPDAEPVAWMWQESWPTDGDSKILTKASLEKPDVAILYVLPHTITPLYTHPPAQADLVEAHIDLVKFAAHEWWRKKGWEGKVRHIQIKRDGRVTVIYNDDEGTQKYGLPVDFIQAALANQPAQSARSDLADELRAEIVELKEEIEERDEWLQIVDTLPLDEFDRLADYWVQRTVTVRLLNAICSVFTKYAPERIMAGFRKSVTDNMHLSFVEGCVAGSRAERSQQTRQPQQPDDGLVGLSEGQMEKLLDDVGLEQTEDSRCLVNDIGRELAALRQRQSGGEG